jgi:hypothetical protein
MSRASTLSGFTTAIGAPTNLNVGVLTAKSVITSGTLSYENLNVTGVSTAVTFNATQTNTNKLSVTGVTTAASLNVTGVSTLASVDVTGNLSVGGTITYEDVTSVDSVGIITAQAGIRVTGGDVNITSGDVYVAGAGSSIGIGTAGPEVSLDISQNTDAIGLPKGTTAQRPTGVEGFIRFNSTSKALEIYDGTNWVEIITDYFPSGSVVLG